MTKFSLISAVTTDFGIGIKNGLPWRHLPVDMRWFKNTTMNQTVIMGRNTWESIGSSALPYRHNIVISRAIPDTTISHDNNTVFCNNLESALQQVRTPKAYVIGGSKLYDTAIIHPNCESLLITHVGKNLAVDTFFPNINQASFKIKKIHNQTTSKIIHHNSDDGDQTTPIEIIEYEKITSDTTISPLSTFANETGYLSALKEIIGRGEERYDRTGVGTKALFGLNFRYDLELGYPLLTTKRMFVNGIIHELLWFLRGETDVKILQKNGVHIWDGNSSRSFLDKIGQYNRKELDIGPSYGFQFRHAGAPYVSADTDYSNVGFDQVNYVLNELRYNPYGRRAIINLWSPLQLSEMALPPCLFQYQFWVSGNNKYLNCSIYQRSGDMGLGVPFNIASASLMMHIFAKLTNLKPKTLVHTIGDAHIYLNHIEPLQRQIARQPRPFPLLQISDRAQWRPEDFEATDIKISGYYPYTGIKMDMAI